LYRSEEDGLVKSSSANNPAVSRVLGPDAVLTARDRALAMTSEPLIRNALEEYGRESRLDPDDAMWGAMGLQLEATTHLHRALSSDINDIKATLRRIEFGGMNSAAHDYNLRTIQGERRASQKLLLKEPDARKLVEEMVEAKRSARSGINLSIVRYAIGHSYGLVRATVRAFYNLFVFISSIPAPFLMIIFTIILFASVVSCAHTDHESIESSDIIIKNDIYVH